jgi:hypothetical protein
MKYSIDTSSLVGAWRRAYPPDLLPRLWDHDLPTLIASGDLRASMEVKIELERQDDELLAWTAECGELFIEVDEPVQDAVRGIMLRHPDLINPNTGRSGADPFIIALARANGSIVVTEEKARPTKPRIPDVCASFGIECINILDLLRREGWTYS